MYYPIFWKGGLYLKACSELWYGWTWYKDYLGGSLWDGRYDYNDGNGDSIFLSNFGGGGAMSLFGPCFRVYTPSTEIGESIQW